ncbi:hypothetical protein CDAR_186471 [Caerostris darwini]|uniref:Uncharacterized protein n=1 Tax=Caerostris darwini TaxID=1538125 RepID=A0AAV4VTC0_9ARAC|nr:hypothetical protein CDAR_186471 [Caerostris darwini]
MAVAFVTPPPFSRPDGWAPSKAYFQIFSGKGGTGSAGLCFRLPPLLNPISEGQTHLAAGHSIRGKKDFGFRPSWERHFTFQRHKNGTREDFSLFVFESNRYINLFK